MDEVIALSPAGRAPIQNFRRSRSSLMLSGSGSGAATPVGHQSSAQSLNSMMMTQQDDGGRRKYAVSQEVNADDLVANNLENAFDRL